MPDIIQLLPDSVANQIAAGEVVQRPSSVIKELVENAIDSGATKITINLKDAGKTLIHVIDNGCGMSATDARMAFERHATSKIKKAEDLFNIRTMGFRGEALASICAVAQVELRTKKHEDELGVELIVHGSKMISQNDIQTASGSQFLVKNLFYNIPARRKFLKKDSTELKHIIDEIQRVAIINVEIHFKLIHNGQEIYNLPASNTKKRLINIFGKTISKDLVPIVSDSPLVKITGFIGKPELAKKRGGQQFFFVNKRFMRHPYFFRTVMNTYQDILSSEYYPSFFIFLDVAPETIDINIHPTKTEIKFEDERFIAQIMAATVKEAIGTFNLTSSMNFDDDQIDMITQPSNKQDVQVPTIHINPNYNPFEPKTLSSMSRSDFKSKPSSNEVRAWMETLKNVSNSHLERQSDFFKKDEVSSNTYKSVLQIALKYIVTSTEKGVMLIHQRRAHQRILYERFLNHFQNAEVASQKLLFPLEHPMPANHLLLVEEVLSELIKVGFEIEIETDKISITSLPIDMTEKQAIDTIDDLVERFGQLNTNIDFERQKFIAKSMSQKSSVGYLTLSLDEMQQIVAELFQTSEPSYCPNGKRIFSIVTLANIEQMLKI